jgi:hypothetical protein
MTMSYTPYTYTSPYDPAREDDGLFGPGSVTWRIMSSRIMWVAVLRALYLQALHPPVAVLAFSTLPGWARRMYGWPGGVLSEAAATAGLRATHLAFTRQWLFHGVLRAIQRAETAGS